MNKCAVQSEATASAEQSGAEDVAHRRTSRSVGWSKATDDARGFDDEKA